MRSLAAGPTTAARPAALGAARQRSPRRHHMLLLLEAWVLRMHLVHAVGDAPEVLEALMRVNSVPFDRARGPSVGAGLGEGAAGGGVGGQSSEGGHRHGHKRRRKSKHRDKDGKRHKRERRESKRDRDSSSEDGAGDEGAHLEGFGMPSGPASWHLPGLQGGTAEAAAVGFPEIAAALTNYALEAWLCPCKAVGLKALEASRQSHNGR